MNVKKKLLASLALAALAFCAMSAPIPSYRVATNIAYAVSSTVVSNTVTRSYIEGLVSGSGGLVNATDIINDITRDSTQATLINRTDGHEDNAIVTIGSVDKQSNLAGLMTVEDKKTLDLHVANTDNPHGVTAEQVGALSISLANTDQTFDWNPSGGGVRLFGTYYGTGIGLSLNSAGGMLYNYHDGTEDWYHLPTGKSGTLALKGDIPKSFATASITNANGNAIDDNGKLNYGKIIDRNGYETHGIAAINGVNEVYITTDGLSTVDDSGYSPYQGVCVKDSSVGWSDFSVNAIHFCPKGDGQLYYYNFQHDSGYIALEGWSSLSRTLYTSDATALATHPTFSNAVLAVGLNIDTNSVAVLNEIADTFGGFPIGGTATTVGGLLAALAAAAAWLKKNKVGSFASVGGASATVENGVAKLDDFFTESNRLLTATVGARLPYPLYAVPSTGILKDRAINTTSLASVTVPDNFTDLLIRASVASSLSVTMPEAIATKYGDTFPGEAGEYLITITTTGAAEAYVRTIKLEVANA